MFRSRSSTVCRPGARTWSSSPAYIVRDDTPSLYGFLETRERVLFSRLLKVQKVGPRLALAMMSAYRAGRLARAIAEQDAKVLIQVSGLGKKTAERVILELSDKVRDIALTEERDGPDAGVAAEAVAALVSLGYTFSAADEAVHEAAREGGCRVGRVDRSARAAGARAAHLRFGSVEGIANATWPDDWK